MNIYIILGILICAFGTYLIYYGATLSSKEDKKDIISTIRKSVPLNKIEEIQQDSRKGYSACFVLKINNVDEKRRKFIVDIGTDSSKNRISLYLDSENNLVYRIKDAESEEHIIKIPRKIYSFQLNVWYFIYFDYGYSNDCSFMRLYINDKLVGDKIFNYKLNIPETIDGKNVFQGTDINKTYFSKFIITSFILARVTMTEKEISGIMKQLTDDM